MRVFYTLTYAHTHSHVGPSSRASTRASICNRKPLRRAHERIFKTRGGASTGAHALDAMPFGLRAPYINICGGGFSPPGNHRHHHRWMPPPPLCQRTASDECVCVSVGFLSPWSNPNHTAIRITRGMVYTLSSNTIWLITSSSRTSMSRFIIDFFCSAFKNSSASEILQS